MAFFKSKGILGINARNLLYIRPYNKKKAIKLADDKIKTKQFLSARDIPVPKLYSTIRDNKELEKFDFNSLPNSFVLKPNNGFGGEGIIPIINKREDYWVTVNGVKVTKEELIAHIQDILDGRYSISNVGDTAFFEQFIIADDVIGKYAYSGLPDIRVVVHNLIPVMAMLRLPTKDSNGKGNLHQGAVGVGIDIAKGQATYICHKNKIIDELPNGLGKIRGLKIPYWDEILLIASKAQLITNIGYLAVDICIDKNTGPVLLEINARAGLNVQVANLAPLRKRLERIEGVKVTSPTKGIRIAKDMFGNTVEKEIEQISGKQIISTDEDVEIIQKKGIYKIHAKVDTGIERSIIDEETAEKTGLLDNVEDYDDEKSTLKLKFSVREKRIQTVADVDKIPGEKYKMIIGARDLKDFLIDTSIAQKESAKELLKKVESEIIPNKKSVKTNYYQIDQQLVALDSKIKLLYHLRPINLESEKAKFFRDFTKNPQFEYPELKFDPLELSEQLDEIDCDNSPLGQLFEEKKKEIQLKLQLLESIDEERFSELSIRLFGQPNENEVIECKKLLEKVNFEGKNSDDKMIDAQEAAKKFEKVFAHYGLDSWKVKLKENMVADCVAGKNNRLFIREKAKFSEERIKSLIVHEIETHILTAENGKSQPYEVFNRGLANYLITQEGMAMYNVETQMNQSFEKNHKALAHVIAIDKALKASFVETFENLLSLGIPIEQAFRSALKAKRGFSDTSVPGAFTKDYIYYKGHREIRQYIEEGHSLKDLYIGKINLKDLAVVKKIDSLREPRLLPDWLK